MSRVTKDPEERREEIVKTARKLFVTKGYNETTVSDIVKAIGAAQGHFILFQFKRTDYDAIVDGYITESLRRRPRLWKPPACHHWKR